MSVRLRLALTVFLTGLATAIGVIATVAVAFQRFEHESTWQRADGFLERVVMQHADLLEQHSRYPEETAGFLRSLLLYEPASRLYLLDGAGTVLASTGRATLAPGFKVALAPVRQAAAREGAYVMGDDPEFMDADAVVAARPLSRAVIAPGQAVAGYLYLVCSKRGERGQRLALFGSTLAAPALWAVLAVVALATALAAWVIVTVTRPLRVLSEAVARAAREGFGPAAQQGVPPAAPRRHDEFGRLHEGFNALLATLRHQWDELRRLDAFRRESVTNLSHDLRSPLTATVACLETMDQRWRGQPARDEDRHLVEVALRNARNAAGLVRSLGDLALLDEPAFQLHPLRLDLAEVLDDIALRYADRAAQRGVALQLEQRGDGVPAATVDAELFERAVANLLDNALKFTPPGGRITLAAQALPGQVLVSVADSGAGIAAHELPHLFDRLFQARSSVAPASSEEGRGLGLAIVKRICELHGGSVEVASEPGRGTTVTLRWPA